MYAGFWRVGLTLCVEEVPPNLPQIRCRCEVKLTSAPQHCFCRSCCPTHVPTTQLHLDLGSEQIMLPTSNDDNTHERPGSTLGGEALLSRPLHANLLSPNSALHSKEMDGMAEMLSSDQQDCINSQPASAELETEVGRQALGHLHGLPWGSLHFFLGPQSNGLRML